MPVQFHFVGVDQILGSHYDEYLVEYTAYMAGGINETDFSKPDMQCIAQTGERRRHVALLVRCSSLLVQRMQPSHPRC